MMVRPQSVIRFIDREPLVNNHSLLHAGYVRHYGKAISVENWERRCAYYADHLPEPYRTKWQNRKGKAIKSDMLSDFGFPLIKWDQKEKEGFRLTSATEANEARKNLKI